MALLKASLVLCITWLACVIGVVTFATAAASDTITKAEHEQLRAEMAIKNATTEQEIAVLRQQMADFDKEMVLDAGRLAAIEATIHIAEGIGISFGTIMVIVQILLLLSHKQAMKQNGNGK